MKSEERRVDRHRRTASGLAALVLWCAAVMASIASGGGLDEAIVLYHEARYVEALQLLDTLGTPATAWSSGPGEFERAAEYRALCLLALERSDEARGVLQKLLERRPDYRPSSPELPPRFLAIADQVRTAMLPALIRTEYRRGKTSYDEKSYQEAQVHFRRALLLIDDRGLAPGARESLGDLRDLADGFLALIPEAVGASIPKLANSLEVLPSVGGADTVHRPAPPAFYTAADPDVRPPVTVRQDLPPWRGEFDDRLMRGPVGTGVLEVVIDERGRVSSAHLATPMSARYDGRLLAAVRSWKYQPATKDGRPVAFRKVIEVRLADAGQSRPRQP